MKGLMESEYAALAQIAGVNAADENGEHAPAYPSEQSDLLLAHSLVEKGYLTPSVQPGSVNSVYPLLDLQHGVTITAEGLAALSRPYIVGTITPSAVLGTRRELDVVFGGLTRVLYGWSDGVVTWTDERTF